VRGRVNPNNPNERADNGRPKERVNSVGPDNRAGNRHLEMKSTKVLAKSWHGFSVKTVNKDVSSGDNFPLREKTRSRASAQRTSLTARWREQPSGHIKGLP
jgi:hypothetical protein